MAFPQSPLDVRTELRIGGTWTNISADTYVRDVATITRGRADEAGRADPSKMSVTLNNRSGKYSPRNPMGVNFGLFGRNTPIRISVPAAANYLRLPGDPGARVTTPDVTALDITGDLDVRIDATLSNWDNVTYVDLIAKYGVGQRSWRLSIAGGCAVFTTSPDGTTALDFTSDLLPVPPSGRLAVRVTIDVNDGASNRVATFYTAASGTAGPWTQLGAVQTVAGVTTIFNSTAPLEIGDITGLVQGANPLGKVHAAEVRSGIGGTVVASPVFTARPAGTASFADSAGRTWSFAGTAEISDREYRLHAEVATWPSKWDVSGKDRYVPIEVAGVLRRYGAGTDPLQSTLRRRIPSEPTLVAYWPAEEGSNSTTAYSPLAGVLPMVTNGLSFAADDTLPGSSPLPSVAAGATILATVPPSTTGAWHLEFVYNIAAAPAGDANATFWAFTTSAGATWRIGIGASLLHLDVTAADGTSLLTSTIVPINFFDGWTRFSIEASQSGGNVAYTVRWTTIGGTSRSASGTYAGTVGYVSGIATTFGAGLDGMRIGHTAVFEALSPGTFDSADKGFDGEQSHARIQRLCTEEGIPVALTAGTGPTAAMGPQRPAPLLDLLGECADADMGSMFELREAPRLAYRRRTSFENQPVALALDYAVDGHIAPPLEPTDDDQQARNDITANRTNGSSARARAVTGPLSVQLPPAGIGPVPGGGTYNVHSDAQLPDMAGWLLHMGTWDDSRYPSVHLDLSAAPSLIPAAMALGIGDRITIAHPPPECGAPGDTLDLIVQGYTESFGAYDWDLVLNCTPGKPWKVGIVGDAVQGRADTEGAQLNAGVTASATSWSVKATAGVLITTDPTNFPLDLLCDGEVVTATACTGASSPQTLTVTRAVNGVSKSHLANTPIGLATPTIVALA